MKTKIISILVLMSLLVSTIGLTGSANQTCSTNDTGGPDPSKTIEVTKLIKNNSHWVSYIEATVGSILRFKINVTYHDTDGEGIGFLLRDIVIKDILPNGLEYAGNPTENPDDISDDGKNITWDINRGLEDNDSYLIEFDIKIITQGCHINNANVSAIETCYD